LQGLGSVVGDSKPTTITAVITIATWLQRLPGLELVGHGRPVGLELQGSIVVAID